MLTNFLIPPLALLATWLLWVGLFTGVGLLVRRLILRTKEITGEALFASFWLGIGATTLFLVMLNFVLPIGATATAVVAGAGVCGLAVHVQPLLRGLTRAGRVRIYATLSALVLVGGWAALHGLQEVAGFDTHMYLVPAVEWFKAQPVPPGLANLNERYGFNQATLPLAAMLESGPWMAGASYLVNGIFVSATLLRIGGSLSNWPGRTRGDRARRFFDLIMLAPVLALVATPIQFRALDADIPATLAILAGLSLMIGPVLDNEPRPDSLVAAGLAFTLGAIFKLSTAAVAVPLWIVLFGLCIRTPATRILIPRLIAASAVLAAAWMARGVVLSGYPLYPSSVLSLPVDWRVPREQVEASSAWVLFFAKMHYAPSQYNNASTALVCGAMSWIGPWFRVLLTSSFWWRVPLPVAIAAILSVPATLNGGLRPALRSIAPIATAIGLGGAIWYALSPRPDLGVPFAWGLAGVIGASVGAASLSFPAGRWVAKLAPPVCLAAGLMLAGLPLGGVLVHELRANPETGRRAALMVLAPAPQPETWFGVTRWEYPSLPYRTASGLDLVRPDFHRCSRAPLLCTSHPARNLRLREPGNLRRGFAVDGGWKAERYPNPNSDFLSVWRAARVNGACEPGLRTSGPPPNFRFERYLMET